MYSINKGLTKKKDISLFLQILQQRVLRSESWIKLWKWAKKSETYLHCIAL